MRDALRTLGVEIVEDNAISRVADHPTRSLCRWWHHRLRPCRNGDAFRSTDRRPGHGTVRFDGDKQAYARPMAPLLGALKHLGARVDGNGYSLPFTLTGNPQLPAATSTVDASESSQFLSGLLLAGARYTDGIDIRARRR